MQLLRRLRYMIRQRQIEAELAEEMELHRSMTGARAFGSGARAANQARDVWIARWLQDLAWDVRFAARLLAKDRRFDGLQPYVDTENSRHETVDAASTIRVHDGRLLTGSRD